MFSIVWIAWRGEASNRRQPLIDESNFDFATIGTLNLPEHAPYWQQLCNHQQPFTADALTVVKSSLERCSLQGGSPSLHLLSLGVPLVISVRSSAACLFQALPCSP